MPTSTTRRTTAYAATLAAVLATALAAVLLAPGVASAEVRTTTDARGDHGGGPNGDIKRVRVNHADHQLRVRTRMYDRVYDGLSVRVDTRRADPGPELMFFANTSGFRAQELYRVDRFADGWRPGRGSSPRRCHRATYHVRWRLDPQRVDVTVPRRCLRTGGRVPRVVRVNVDVFEEFGDGDKAPGARRFGPRVPAG